MKDRSRQNGNTKKKLGQPTDLSHNPLGWYTHYNGIHITQLIEILYLVAFLSG